MALPERDDCRGVRAHPAATAGDAQRDVKAREQIIIALFNGRPAHLQGALSELRIVMELVGTAREGCWDSRSGANQDVRISCAIRG
jgi:hypothetical protein